MGPIPQIQIVASHLHASLREILRRFLALTHLRYDPTALMLASLAVALVLVSVHCRDWKIETPMSPP